MVLVLMHRLKFLPTSKSESGQDSASSRSSGKSIISGVSVDKSSQCGSENGVSHTGNRKGGNPILQSAPRTLKEWMLQMESCSFCLELVARTPQELSEYRKTLARWRASGHPDPEVWLEPDLARRLRFRCSCPD